MTTTIYKQLHHELTEALSATRMERAGFGFPNDRIVIKSSHFDNQGFKTGSEVHPTEFIVKATENYRWSWIEGPLLRVLHLIETNKELLERSQELAQALQALQIDRIADLVERANKN